MKPSHHDQLLHTLAAFTGQLPLQPTAEGRIVGAAAEHLPQFGVVFGRGGQLRRPAPLQLLAALRLAAVGMVNRSPCRVVMRPSR